jgi:hypothetical protein
MRTCPPALKLKINYTFCPTKQLKKDPWQYFGKKT